MFKCVCIGDLHCRDVWKKIVEKEKDADKIVFLGDITCPRDVKFDDLTDACSFLYEVLDFKDKHPNQVVILRGNHDMASLGYYWARCYPQDHLKVQQYWQTDDVKNWYLKNSQWVYQLPEEFENIICSHAGLSKTFINNVDNYLRLIMNIKYPYDEYNETLLSYHVIDHINQIKPNELFGFTDDNPWDTNGTSKCQPCTWIRPQTLIEDAPSCFIQVVGHTPVADHIFDAGKYCNTSKYLWCCDALGLDNPEYLVIEDGNFKICNI